MRGRGLALLLVAACSTPAGPAGSAAPAASSAPAPEASITAVRVSFLVPPEAPPAKPAPPPGMLEIPGSFFLMGSFDGEGTPEEHPSYEVAMPSFWLDENEVTVAAYRACEQAGACKHPHAGTYCNLDMKDRDKHPANCTDWTHADAYCAWAKKRLPTEEEWEYAARGGKEHRKFSWGAEDPTEKIACYHHMGSCEVGSFPPGAFGLRDMSGNVWEWTSTPYGEYPRGPFLEDYRVYRGGSWSRRFPHWLRNGLRNRYRKHEWSASIGFRCALSKPTLECPEGSAPKDGRCARTSGDPACEANKHWDGTKCASGAILPPEARVRTGGAAPAASGSADAGPKVDPDVITRARTPEHDDDCRRNYPGKPEAWKWSGATFHARNKPLEAAGCSRRVMGSNWTSTCCPGAAPKDPKPAGDAGVE